MQISEYDFDVMKVIKEGLKRIEGVKQSFVLASLIYIVIAIVIHTGLSLLFPSSVEDPNLVNQQIVGILSYPVLMPLMAGIIMMAIKHTKEEPVEPKSIFDYYDKMGHLALAGLLVYVMTILGFLLLILPGIYLSVAYVFTIPLIADKGLGVWDAMELSRKTVGKQWFKVASVMGILSVLCLVGFLLFGIGLIWAIPLFFVTMYGLLYVMIFDEIEEVNR
jgi:uncharacterized membrane protein